MRRFRVASTGDFLGVDGKPAYGEVEIERLASEGRIEHHFLTGIAPRDGDSEYWKRFYSLEVEPEHLEKIDGLIVLRPWVTRRSFAQGAKDLLVIGRSGAGYDKIDLVACSDHGVAVFNAPMALNHSTASSALLFMLALAKRLPEQERITRSGRWDLQSAAMGDEIQGRTLGIIGLGHSGRELVRLAAPFQMRVLAYSPRADRAQSSALGVELTSLERLLGESDFISLHARLTPETHKMIGAPQLARMKPSAYLINISRGELIDQPALASALERRTIRGAALDVFETEPLEKDDPILRLDNVIVTPHWSCSTSDVWRATGAAMAAGMLLASQGRVPDNIVNPAALDHPLFRSKLARFADS